MQLLCPDSRGIPNRDKAALEVNLILSAIGVPYVSLPIGASLLKIGSGVVPVMTLILSSMVVAVTRIPYEISFIDWRFSLLRLLVCLLVPPVCGFIIHYVSPLFGYMKL